MPTLRITLNKGQQLSDIPIAVEVVDSDLETDWKGAIKLGEEKVIEGLEAGYYSIQATLPSGRKLTKACNVQADQPASVELSLVGTSPRESLEWATISKPNVLANAKQREAQLRSVWLRLWARESDGRWCVRPWPTQNPDREPGLVQYHFRFLSEQKFGQYYLQVGGPTMQWRLIALPADDISVLITGADAGAESDASGQRDDADSAVDVSVTSKKHDAEVLLSYLTQGKVDQARLVGESLIALELLSGKRNNPTAAAIAGYFLLLCGDFNKLNQVWTNNLVNWMKWLPDGAVIDGWYRMRIKPPDHKRAKQRLLEAAARGMPVYKCGLRLLLDGLTSYNDDPSFGGPDVSAALKSVRRYAAAADWRAPITTFIGCDPDSPGKTKLGKPEDSTHVIFLTDADPEDIEWKRRGTLWFGARSSTGMIGDASIAPEQTDLEIEQTSRVALGEAGESVEPVVVTRKASEEEIVKLSEVSEQRYRAVSMRASQQAFMPASSAMSLESVRPMADTPDRTLARLFHAAAAQTQSERMFDTGPVTLLSEIESPVKLCGLALARIMGTSDLLSIAYLERGIAAARTVGRLTVGGQERIKFATAFLVAPRLLMTNHHVLPNLNEALKSYVEFDYQDGADGRLRQTTRIPLDASTFFVTDEHLDISIVALNSKSESCSFGWNRLSAEQGKILIGECISVVQHAAGAPKQVSIRENRLLDIIPDFIHYESDTAAPSSGAPLFNDQWEVVGMHRTSIPRKDSQGRILTQDGREWTPDMGPHQIQFIAHEGVRISSIIRHLKELNLSRQQAELRDKLLFSKPAAT
jgi:V8-like Glu-specific endopeptidase